MKYCGIDLHSNNSVVIVSDEEDRIVFHKHLPNDLRQIAEALEPRAIALGCHSGVSPSSAMRASSSQPMALRRRRRLFLGAEGAEES